MLIIPLIHSGVYYVSLVILSPINVNTTQQTSVMLVEIIENAS